MKFKRIFLITLLLLTVLTISSVSADENMTAEVVGADENITNEFVSLNDDCVGDTKDNIEENDQFLSYDGNDEKLATNLDGIRIELWTNDFYYEYSKNGYEISAWIDDVYYDDDADYYLNLQIYDENNNLVFNSTKEVKKSYYYDDMTNFKVKLAGGQYSTILTASMISSYGRYTSESFKYDIYLESKAEYESDLYDYDDEDFSEPVKIKAPAVTVKLKAKKYFTITIKDYQGSSVGYEYAIVKIWTGNKVKTYTKKTNSKGIIKICTNNLKLGTHKVKISFLGSDYYKSKSITSKIIVKKTITTPKKKTTTKKSSTPTVVNGKYNNKNAITVTVKDGKKTIKVKCVYKKGYKQYLGSTYKYGKKYSVYVAYENKDGMQGGKKGWWTSGTNAGMADNAKTDTRYNRNHPVTSLSLH